MQVSNLAGVESYLENREHNISLSCNGIARFINVSEVVVYFIYRSYLNMT